MGMTERLDLEAVKARHEATGRDCPECWLAPVHYEEEAGLKAHADRAALICEVEALREALKLMVDEKCDYMRINNLGDPETQHTVRLARAVLPETEEK
jgi:hypothetical protein